MLRIARSLRYFIVENAQSARAELKQIETEHPLRDIDIRVLPRAPKQSDLDALLASLVAGQSADLMSEAGASRPRRLGGARGSCRGHSRGAAGGTSESVAGVDGLRPELAMFFLPWLSTSA